MLVQLYAGDDRVEQPGGHPDERLVLCGRNRHASRDSAGVVKQAAGKTNR